MHMEFFHQNLGTTNLSSATIAPVIEHVGKNTVSVKSRLAEGAYGLVDLVVDQYSQKEYVLKRCSIQCPENFEIVNKEIKMLKTFSGPYVVEYIASEIVNTAKGREALILLACCPGGNLFEKLSARNGKYIPFENCLTIFHQTLQGVQRFHNHAPPVTHRDLKLENLLFAADGTIRLCDFGSCSIGHTYLRNAADRAAAEEVIAKETTPMYRAPELIDLYLRDVLTEKSDIWALGCIFAATCYLKHPFQDVGTLGILNGTSRIHFPADSLAPPEAKELILYMLDMDPEARPTIDQLICFVSEMLAGNGLPHYELTDEAKQKREERIQANFIREQKRNAKKAHASVVPERKDGPVGVLPDSVAAKRLAAKRGGMEAVATTQQRSFDKAHTMSRANPQQLLGVTSNRSADSLLSVTSTPFEANFAQFATFDPLSLSTAVNPVEITNSSREGSFGSRSGASFDAFHLNTEPSTTLTGASTTPPMVTSADFLFDNQDGVHDPVPLKSYGVDTLHKSVPVIAPSINAPIPVVDLPLSFDTSAQYTDPFSPTVGVQSGFAPTVPKTSTALPTDSPRSNRNLGKSQDSSLAIFTADKSYSTEKNNMHSKSSSSLFDTFNLPMSAMSNSDSFKSNPIIPQKPQKPQKPARVNDSVTSSNKGIALSSSVANNTIANDTKQQQSFGVTDAQDIGFDDSFLNAFNPPAASTAQPAVNRSKPNLAINPAPATHQLVHLQRQGYPNINSPATTPKPTPANIMHTSSSHTSQHSNLAFHAPKSSAASGINDMVDLLDLPPSPTAVKQHAASQGPVDLLSQDTAPVRPQAKTITLDQLLDPFQTSIRSQPTVPSSPNARLGAGNSFILVSSSSDWPPTTNINIISSAVYSPTTQSTVEPVRFRGQGSTSGQNTDPFAKLNVIPGKK